MAALVALVVLLTQTSILFVRYEPLEQFEQLKLQLQFLNHKLPKDAVKCLSPLARGLLHITVQETLSSMGKAISLHLLVVRGLEIVIVILTVQTVQLNSSVIMSWAKQSADAGWLDFMSGRWQEVLWGRRWT